jgi:hypothetical protein
VEGSEHGSGTIYGYCRFQEVGCRFVVDDVVFGYDVLFGIPCLQGV